MVSVKPVNQFYNTLNSIEKLRADNENNRAKLQRKNDIKTSLKALTVAAAMPYTAGAVVMSGFDKENMQVNYKIPKLFEKSETLKKIGLKIDKGIYNTIDKTSSFLRKPKYQQLIEKSDKFIDNISTKVFKKENELKYLPGGMTALGIKVIGTALLGGIAVKGLMNHFIINKEYRANQQNLKEQQFDAVKQYITDMQKTQ
jgi:hypothetical protein